MNKQEINRLLKDYANGVCTPEENRLVEELLDRMAAGMPMPSGDKSIAEIGEELFQHLDIARNKQLSAGKTGRFNVVRLAAASVLLLLGLSVFLLYRMQSIQSTQMDIRPAGNKAKITLSNGKEIALDEKDSLIVMHEGNAHYTNGKSVIMTKEKKIRLETPKGGIYQLVLEDGTHVWLNTASAISYPSNFDETRMVELEGEAYFSVSKTTKGAAHTSRPFIVKTGEQVLTVLGTEFNVNAYPGSTTERTTLVSGKVRLATKNNLKKTVELKPSQRASLQNDGFDVEEVDFDDELAWMIKKFVFNDEPLHDIMQRIARWYDLEVEYKGVNKNQRFGGTISCFADVKDVLEKLELTKGVHFKLEGRKVMVLP